MRETEQKLSDAHVHVHAVDQERRIVIDFEKADGSHYSLSCTEADLSALVIVLGAAHAKIVEGTSTPSLNGARATAVHDPRWLVQYETAIDASSLFFQHPAYGPIAFTVPRRELYAMSKALLVHANIPPAEQQAIN
jgi:hypothetical protein